MTTAHIDLTAIGDDESRRRRDQRGAKALIVLAGMILLAFAGRDPEPVLRLNGAATDFGSQIVGTRLSKTVGLRNAARTPFVVAGIVAEGASTQDFSIDVTACARTLPGALCNATVWFSPHVTGLQSAKFRIVDASNDRSETIVIQGAGMLPVSVPTQEPIAPAAQPAAQPVMPTGIVPPSTVPNPEPNPVTPPPNPGPVHVKPLPNPGPVHVTPPPNPEPVPVTPRPNHAPPPTPGPTVTEIVVPMPAENATHSAMPTPHVPTPVVVTETTPEPPTNVAETKTPDAPAATTTREPSRTGERFRRFAAVAIPLIAGAVIANQNRGHGDHNGEHNADRRIDVSPRSLTLRSNPNIGATNDYATNNQTMQASPNIVTVTNVGRDSVTISSIEFAGGPAGIFGKRTDCERRTLAPKAQCRIWVALVKSVREARSTLVVNSDGGRATVALATASYTTGKP